MNAAQQEIDEALGSHSRVRLAALHRKYDERGRPDIYLVLMDVATDEYLLKALEAGHVVYGDGVYDYVIEQIAELRDICKAHDACDLPDGHQLVRLGGSGHRPRLAPTLGKEVLERDAYRCQRCGGWRDLEIDHIVPVSAGGPTVAANLQTLCSRCNREKGSRLELVSD